MTYAVHVLTMMTLGRLLISGLLRVLVGYNFLFAIACLMLLRF